MQVPRLSAPCRLARAIAFGLALRLLCALTVEGADRLPAEGPLLLAANHSSHLDGPAILAALPAGLRDRTLVAAADDYFYRDRLWAAAASLLGAFPFVRRGGPAALRVGLDRTTALLEAGWSVLVFPEGTRSRDGRLAPFRPGAVCVAGRSGATVVPVAVVGSHLAWPPGCWPRGGAVTVRFGRPWTVPPGAAEPAAASLAAAVAELAGRRPEVTA
ncbi:MAG TPA: lysophospholipid acyltransferase family protein [Chloroflexota bacterium]